MNCPHCQQENRETAKFCSACGVKLALTCSPCKNEMPPQARFCDQCGAPLISRDRPTADQPEAVSSPHLQTEAEPRHLTVMFCDLAGSTQLSQQLDLEDLREVVREYQAMERTDDAQVLLQNAIDFAIGQQAKSWELRAKRDLAQIWFEEGKAREARNLLAPAYNWFTEGLDTPDLQEAALLLARLGVPEEKIPS